MYKSPSGVTYTCLFHNTRRLWTRKRNQIDFIRVNGRFRNSIQAKGYPVAERYSDHVLLICHMQIKLRQLKNTEASRRLVQNLLREDKGLKEKYREAVQNRLSMLQVEGEKGVSMARDFWSCPQGSLWDSSKKKGQEEKKEMEYFGNNLRLKEKRRIEKHNGEAYEIW